MKNPVVKLFLTVLITATVFASGYVAYAKSSFHFSSLKNVLGASILGAFTNTPASQPVVKPTITLAVEDT